MKIKSIKKKTDKPEKVYNLHVNNNHNYFANGVLVANCHSTKSASIQSIAKKAKNAEYRLGLTGTLPTVDADNFNIHGYLGPTIYQQRSDDLIDRGVLSKIKIANILLKYPLDVITKNKRRPYIEETETVYGYGRRNRAFNHILDNVPDGQNTLILCHLIEHLKDIKKHLEDTLDPKYTIYEYHGSVKTDKREHIRNIMDSDKSYRLDMGVGYIELVENSEVLLTNGNIKLVQYIDCNDDIDDNWIKKQILFK